MQGQSAGKLVLLVEDHDDTRGIIAKVLVHLGYRVVSAASAAEARARMAAADGDRPDVVLSDVGLRDADGCDLMRELRAAYDVPGVALTGHAAHEDIERCRAAGFGRVVVKPAMIDAISAALSAVLAPPAPSAE